jgi:hypothetical protein
VKQAPPTDRVDHTELPTLQNLGNLPSHLALVPLFFNNLQRYAGPMFSPEIAGHTLQMGPYSICGVNRWVNGVEYTLEDGSTYGMSAIRRVGSSSRSATG